jgi:rRNA maturation RNase YbeY
VESQLSLTVCTAPLPDASSPAPPASIQIEQVHPERHLDEEPLRALLHTIAAEEDCRLGSVTVVLTDHETVLQLNRDYLDHDYLTDVLSFDLSDEPERVVGEIYVDLDTAAERHAEFNTTFEGEVHRYAAHGLLHLIGYDDDTPEERALMRRLEDRYLSASS